MTDEKLTILCTVSFVAALDVIVFKKYRLFIESVLPNVRFNSNWRVI
jgi:hypothetical protein